VSLREIRKGVEIVSVGPRLYHVAILKFCDYACCYLLIYYTYLQTKTTNDVIVDVIWLLFCGV